MRLGFGNIGLAPALEEFGGAAEGTSVPKLRAGTRRAGSPELSVIHLSLLMISRVH